MWTGLGAALASAQPCPENDRLLDGGALDLEAIFLIAAQ
jgi:hypothetical protein